jgi:beta-glucanase (GH16 family)
MESIGREPTIIHGAAHSPECAGGNAISAQTRLRAGGPFRDCFHFFGIEWSPGSVEFFVDRVPYAKVTPASLPDGARWVFDKPFFLLLNLAVGGDWPGNPDLTTRFPQTMLVDWVRVWKPLGKGGGK